MTAPNNLHASCILLPAHNHTGVLITGAAGSGKSSLAWQLLDRGGLLVSDDQTLLQPEPEGLTATAPGNLHGLIELRGYGILRLPPGKIAAIAVIRLCVRLMLDIEQAERLPETPITPIFGVSVPFLPLAMHDPAAAAKIFAALAYPLLDYTHA